MDFPMIDGWVNPNLATTTVDPTVASLFPGLLERRTRGTTLSELVDEMDAAGVERAVLCAGYRGADNIPWVNAALEQHPGRFAGSLVVDPRNGISAVRALEEAVQDLGYVAARVMALETQLPYDHAYYYPLYAKCSELGIALTVNVGLPGPRVPGRHQDPMALDEVCWYFPDLTLVMAHGGDPWADVCVKLMTKWENLHYMSSAYAPSRLPRAILDYAQGVGSHKVMWASDYPILDFARCRDSIARMPFVDEPARRRFCYDNARALFFRDASAPLDVPA